MVETVRRVEMAAHGIIRLHSPRCACCVMSAWAVLKEPLAYGCCPSMGHRDRHFREVRRACAWGWGGAKGTGF